MNAINNSTSSKRLLQPVLNRRNKGAQIASVGGVREHHFGWLVTAPEGTYYVTRKGDNGYACECEDYQQTQEPCACIRATVIFCKAQGRAVEARFSGQLTDLYNRTRIRIRTAKDLFTFDCLSALLLACEAEGREVVGAA